jgi:hypothetical protein
LHEAIFLGHSTHKFKVSKKKTQIDGKKKKNLNPKSYEGMRIYSPNMGHGSRLHQSKLN